MPSTARDFQRAAKQRLDTAVFLLANDYTLDAMYLGGYTIECSLKALILELTPSAKKQETLRKISSGQKMHNPEILAEMLKVLAEPVPARLVKRFRRAGWSTNLRYECGRMDSSETRAFLKTAQTVHDWVEGKLP